MHSRGNPNSGASQCRLPRLSFVFSSVSELSFSLRKEKHGKGSSSCVFWMSWNCTANLHLRAVAAFRLGTGAYSQALLLVSRLRCSWYIGGCVASQGARHYGRCFLTAAVSPRASQIPNLRQILQRCRAQSPLFLRLIRQHCALQERSWLIWALWLIKLQYSCRAHLEVQKLRSTTYDDDDVHDEDDDAGQ